MQKARGLEKGGGQSAVIVSLRLPFGGWGFSLALRREALKGGYAANPVLCIRAALNAMCMFRGVSVFAARVGAPNGASI